VSSLDHHHTLNKNPSYPWPEVGNPGWPWHNASEVHIPQHTTQASTPPLAPKPANPLASAVQPSAGTGAGASVPEVEHTTLGVFQVSLKGLGASAQDIEALRRIRALIAGKAAAIQQEQEAQPSSSQAQPPRQQGAAPAHTAPDDVDFNIRQAE
jgi:hypothetical protein